MKVGDVVEYDGRRWRVYKEDKHVKTVTLIAWTGATEEVTLDDARVKVVADPSRWPFVTVKVNLKAGPLIDLILTRGRTRSLRPLVDWLPSDQTRHGGSIFVSPQLKLKLGETLIAVHTNGTRSRITITREFGSIASRRRRRAVRAEVVDQLALLEGDDFVVE